MATLTPDEGLEWLIERALDENDVDGEKVYEIAVGSGTSSLSSNDTQLDQEEYRTNSDVSNASITNTSPQQGTMECKITISGGTEVPAGTSITEIGVFARDPSIPSGSVTDSDDTMVYRELRPSITLASGDRKTFAFTINAVN